MSYGWKKHPLESWRLWLFRQLFKKEYDVLQWYSDEWHWNAIHAVEQTSLINVDRGLKAREVLGREDQWAK